MHAWIETILTLLVLTNLVVLGSSRVWSTIPIVAAQGVLLGILTLVARAGDLTAEVLLLAGGTMIVKGLIFPALLYRATRDADVRSPLEPYVGYTLSVGVGILIVLCSLWLGSRLPLPQAQLSPLVVPVALATILSGFFLIVSRRKALTQVLGYLVLENGIYAFGVAVLVQVPFSVELGILLDLIVAVLVMGVALFDINRGFDHIDTAMLSTLKE
ncbi:MAG: hydrogenase [Candidatus Sericytochromatia bacterium]|nr:hydrogenase [Candidatus Tanganyikabacteria bacterium]